MMNSVIEKAFSNFAVDGVSIPVAFVYYDGHSQPYVTYQQTGADNSYSGDDDILGYVEYYDFDIYSKSDYSGIIDKVKQILKENGFTLQPTMCSEDMYETDTGYFHKTLCFAIPKGV